jgi:hypothetical protein
VTHDAFNNARGAPKIRSGYLFEKQGPANSSHRTDGGFQPSGAAKSHRMVLLLLSTTRQIAR